MYYIKQVIYIVHDEEVDKETAMKHFCKDNNDSKNDNSKNITKKSTGKKEVPKINLEK